MKKVLLLLVAGLLTLAGSAQTHFRELSYQEAIDAAKAEHKLVFIDFYTQWCGPCRIMLQQTFPQPRLGDYLNERFVCIKLDAEKGEGKELAKRYRVRAYPTFIGIDTNEKEVMRREGGASVDEMIALVQSQIEKGNDLASLQKRYDAGERTAELMSVFAPLKMNSARGKNADLAKQQEVREMVADYFAQLDDAGKCQEQNFFIYANFTKHATEPAGIYLIRHRQAFDPSIEEKVTAQINKLCNTEMHDYLKNKCGYDAQAFALFKQLVAESRCDTDGSYAAALKIVSSYHTKSRKAFLKCIKKEFGHMNHLMQRQLLANLSAFVGNDDEAYRRQVAAYAREELPKVSRGSGETLLITQDLRKIETWQAQ